MSQTHEVKYIFTVQISFCARNGIKNETKNVTAIVSLVKVLQFFWSFSMVAPVFKPDFYIFFYDKHFRKNFRNFINKFLLYHTSLRVDLEYPYFQNQTIFGHIKLWHINTLNFIWIIIAPFIFMQLADLCVYAMINFVYWQNTKYR